MYIYPGAKLGEFWFALHTSIDARVVSSKAIGSWLVSFFHSWDLGAPGTCAYPNYLG